MSRYAAANIRNIVLVGHGAVGKTTLADQILFQAGVGSRAGSVDDGTSQLDTDQESRDHHFSISAALAHVEHHGMRINLIDTPGYPDFVGQVISAVCAAETAVVTISATAGIEANTRRTFELAGKAQLARFIVLNKLDRENIDFPRLVDLVQETFGRRCIPLNVPCVTGAGFTAVHSTLKFARTSGNGVAGDPAVWGSALMEAIVEADEALMERYFEGEELPAGDILGGIHRAIATGSLIPIFCTSAKTGIGVPELMDAITDFALRPGELVRHGTSDGGQDEAVSSSEDAPLVARVFKTRIDPFVSKLSFIRVLSGKLTKDSIVRDVRSGKGVRIHQMLDMQGGHAESVDEAHAGDVVAIAKVEEFRVGDTLVAGNGSLSLPMIDFPAPIIGLAVEPKSRADQQKIAGALHRIEEEDPTILITHDSQTNELVMRGMSDLHLQIVQERLHKRDKVDIITHAPKVAYREACNGTAEGSFRHKKQSGGSGQFAEVHLRIVPLPPDSDPAEFFTQARFPQLREYHYHRDLNFAFVDCVSGGSVPNQFIPPVEKGILERMERGVLAGYQIQDIAVVLFYGKHHAVDSNEAAFRTAGSRCFRDIFLQAQPSLLEPLLHLVVRIPGDFVGSVTSDLNVRRGRVEGMETHPDGMTEVHARVPLAELATYARTLSGLTGGQGSFAMEFSHYQQVPASEQQRLTASQPKQDDE